LRLQTHGLHHDLRALFDGLNSRYFRGQICAGITWGRRRASGLPRSHRSVKMGSYAVEDRLIRIHPLLDRPFVPRYYVEWIIYHEMLHQKHPIPVIDGRRISKAPFSGQAQDLNAIPLAAVERIEILSDGASAIYGSDAIGGVVNIITRKNFNGVQLTYGQGDPQVTGGNTREMSLLWGVSGAKGRMFAGISSADRDMIFTRDQIGGGTQGVSSYGNNYRRASTTTGGPTGAFVRVPGFACNTNNFWVTTSNTCSFDFNKIAANEASVSNKAAFANGEFNINDNWTTYMSGSVSKVGTFGRYAPTPVEVFLDPSSPA